MTQLPKSYELIKEGAKKIPATVVFNLFCAICFADDGTYTPARFVAQGISACEKHLKIMLERENAAIEMAKRESEQKKDAASKPKV